MSCETEDFSTYAKQTLHHHDRHETSKGRIEGGPPTLIPSPVEAPLSVAVLSRATLVAVYAEFVPHRGVKRALARVVQLSAEEPLGTAPSHKAKDGP